MAVLTLTDGDPGYMTRKIRKFQRINSIRETNGNFDSCNSCKRLGTSRLHELHESKFPFVSRIEFIRWNFRIFLVMYPGSVWEDTGATHPPGQSTNAGTHHARLLYYLPECYLLLSKEYYLPRTKECVSYYMTCAFFVYANKMHIRTIRDEDKRDENMCRRNVDDERTKNAMNHRKWKCKRFQHDKKPQMKYDGRNEAKRYSATVQPFLHFK